MEEEHKVPQDHQDPPESDIGNMSMSTMLMMIPLQMGHEKVFNINLYLVTNLDLRKMVTKSLSGTRPSPLCTRPPGNQICLERAIKSFKKALMM